MIQAAIFDIGNVLLRFDYLLAAERLSQRNQLHRLPDRERIVAFKNAYEAGQISREEFLKHAMPEFNHHGSSEEFIRIWEDIFEPNEPMVEVARQLQQHIPIYLLSNIGCIHHEYIFRKYPFFQLFHDGIFSYRVGYLKPDPQIYQIAIEQFGINPSHTLFIDDLSENVEGAKQAGFHAIQYDLNQHNATVDLLGKLNLIAK